MNILKLLAGASLALGLLASPIQAQERFSIGTGGTGGLFYIIGAGMAEVLNKNLPDSTTRAEVTGASVENIHRVVADQLTFGFSSSSTLYEASVGEGPFQEAQPVAALAYLYPAVMQLATTTDTGVKTIKDLAGKRVNLGPPGSNAAVLAQRLLEAYGVFDPSKAQFLSYNEGTAALMNDQLDAAVVLAGAPTAALIDLGSQRDMILLSIDEETIKPMLDKYPYYQIYTLAPNTYEGQTETVLMINDPATLFTSKNAPEATIYAITKSMFDNLDSLAQVHPQAADIAIETATQTPIPLHPGAQRYFNEVSVSSRE